MQIEIAGQKGALWWRYYDHKTCCSSNPSTSAVLAIEGEPNHRVGHARCCPTDRFSKDVGRKISLSRLLQSMNLSKEERRKVWEQYHSRKQGGAH